MGSQNSIRSLIPVLTDDLRVQDFSGINRKRTGIRTEAWKCDWTVFHGKLNAWRAAAYGSKESGFLRRVHTKEPGNWQLAVLWSGGETKPEYLWGMPTYGKMCVCYIQIPHHFI